MTKYQEYCPQGLTDSVVDFEITGGRIPSASSRCICGGTDLEKAVLHAAVLATISGAANAIFESISTGGKPVSHTQFTTTVHSSAIRIVS